MLSVFVQNVETVKFLSSTKQQQDDLLRAKEQLESELENLRQEKKNMVRPHDLPTHKPLQTPPDGVCFKQTVENKTLMNIDECSLSIR